MEEESHRTAGRDVIIGFGGLIEDGKDGVYSFGEMLGRVCVAEKDI